MTTHGHLTTTAWSHNVVTLGPARAERPSTARALGVLERIALAASAVVEMRSQSGEVTVAGQPDDRELLALFAASPEAHALETNDAWTAMLLLHARNDLATSAAALSADILHEVLFDIFPRVVSCEATAAADIVTELRAFFTYLGREHSFENAPECLAVLAEGAEDNLRDVLADHTLFGLAKLDLMADREAVFDMMTAGTDA